MIEFRVSMDKETYRAGEDARIDVWVDWDPPESKTDVWAYLDIEVKDPRSGQWTSDYHYDPAPLHDADPDEPVSKTWWCHPIRRGQWGTYRVNATFYEPEDKEVGEAALEFEVAKA